MFNGVEVDVLSLGDADCTVVTKWHDSYPHRILIDGGSGADAELIVDFLRKRNYASFWAIVCTHLHKDHARGLIRIVQNKNIAITKGWMHDIRKHLSPDALRRASAADDGVKEVVETTKELASAFAFRNVTPQEPFAGSIIAGWPSMTVLGPTLQYYRSVIRDFADVAPTLAPTPPQPSWLALAALAGNTPPTGLSLLGGLALPAQTNFSSLFPPPPRSNPAIPPISLRGVLSKSSVQEKPATQPYNNTSAILGVEFNGSKLLFTSDAGSDALSNVDANWHRLLYMGVPHHGSDGNLSQSDIERFCPLFLAN